MDIEPRIGVFADDEESIAAQRSWFLDEVPNVEVELVTAIDQFSLERDLNKLKPNLSRIGLLIADQYTNGIGMRRLMNDFITDLKKVNPDSWVIETGALAEHSGVGKQYQAADTLLQSIDLYVCLNDISETTPNNYPMRLRKLITETAHPFREAKFAIGKIGGQEPFDPERSLFQAAGRSKYFDLMQLVGRSPEQVQSIMEGYSLGVQKDIMHSIWMSLGYLETKLGPDYYASSLDRLKSLLDTGFPAKMPE